MQILARFLIVCALAAIITPLSSRGADTDAQMKAREALRQKMGELEAQPVMTNAAPPPAAPSKAPKTKPAPAPVVTKPAETVKTVPPPTPPPARTVEPTPSPTPAPAPVVKTTRPPKPAPVAKSAPPSGQVTASRPDSERIAKAREALEQKLKELDTQGGQPAVANQPAPSQPTPSQPAPARAVTSSQPAPSTPPAPVFHTPEITSTTTPQRSVSADTSEPLPTPPPPKRSAEAESKPQKSKKPNTSKPEPMPRQTYGLPPGPPPPVSAEKVQKLNALLQQYQADRITPEQYHQERAKILAGP